MTSLERHLDRNYVQVEERRAAYRRLVAAQEDNPAGCDIRTEPGRYWDDMTPTEQKKVCRTCPVKELCLAYAETAPVETHGVWGGQLFPRRPDAVKAAARLEKQAQRAKRKEPR